MGGARTKQVTRLKQCSCKLDVTTVKQWKLSTRFERQKHYHKCKLSQSSMHLRPARLRSQIDSQLCMRYVFLQHVGASIYKGDTWETKGYASMSCSKAFQYLEQDGFRCIALSNHLSGLCIVSTIWFC
uniref:Uncharacterized protein n=1 Tax=Arundo donax TaxID=35708 RepID=A0A0A9EVW2_ARUDO